MEKITFDECIKERTTAGAFLMKLLSQARVSDNSIWDEIFNKSVDSKEFEVELKINGVDVSFNKVIEYLWDSYNRDVQKKAFYLVKEKFEKVEDISNSISSILSSAKREIVFNLLNELPDLDIHEDDMY